MPLPVIVEFPPAVASASNPSVLPAVVLQESVCVPVAEPWQDDAFAHVATPPDLVDAVPVRRLHFRAGRHCALVALERLSPGLPRGPIERADSGAPVWPSDVVGSITHTHGFVSAAVGLASQVQGVGIDSEQIVSSERARAVTTRVAWSSELAHARQAGMDRLQALTLVFSAKESIFKCLYPLTGVRFYYHDARIERVDRDTRTFCARLVKALSPRFPADTVIEGRFDVTDTLAHTGVCLLGQPVSS